MNSWRLSQASEDLVTRLNRKVGWWESLSQADRRAEMITSLGNSQELGLVPWLAPFALSSHDGIRHASRKALDHLLKLVPIEQLIAFDAFARQGGPVWSPRNSWQTLEATGVEEFGRDEGIGVLSLASMHSNGRVREAALRILTTRDGGQELPFLLLRTNDWVKPVREYAQAGVLARLNSKYAGAFLSCLPLVLRLEHCARTQHEELVTRIGRLLVSDECRPVLEEGLRSEDHQIRLACLRFANSLGGTASREILLAALDDENPLIRLYVVRQLLGAVQGEERNRILEKLRQDAFMPIRREALQAQVLRDDEGRSDTLSAALLDRHRSIREFARFHLNDRIDIPQFYRDAIDARPGRLAATIRGLGECGSKPDAQLIVSFLDSSEIRLREAAVTAIGQLDARGFEESLRVFLSDPAARVSKAACTALEPLFAAKTNLQPYDSILGGHPDFRVRKRALRLIVRSSKWVRLSHLLSACRDPSDEVAAFAAVKVAACLRLYNRDFTMPTPLQLTEIARELRHSQEFLETQVAIELAAIIEKAKP